MSKRLRVFRVVVPAAALVVLLFLPALIAAQTVFHNPETGYVVDIPYGWEVIDAQRLDSISFSDPERVAVFQIATFPGNRFATVEELERFIRGQFGARGDAIPFDYHNAPAIFADYSFTAGRIPVRGYMVFLNRTDYDVAIMTFAAQDHYEDYHDILLSALDSFSPDIATRLLPGPVSGFFFAVEQPNLPSDTVLVLPSGAEYRLPRGVAHEGVVDAAQVLIEREARILSAYAPAPGESALVDNAAPPAWGVAWRRYFRALYRDSYERLAPVAEALYHDLAEQGVPHEQFPSRILRWLQGARYARTTTLSDLASPSMCLVEFAGDCDSLGLTYAILLHHLGFDTILMVSMAFSHALVGVDVAGPGARFEFEGRSWLVAELTADVEIGMIDQTMANPAGWLGIKLDPTVRW